MSVDKQPWYEKAIIPTDISYEDLFYELLHRTKRNTIKVGYDIQLCSVGTSEGLIDKEQLMSLLLDADRNIKDLWDFINKLEAFRKAKQEESIKDPKN